MRYAERLDDRNIPLIPPTSMKLTASRRRYVSGLLLAIAVTNYIDRQVMNILAEPIKNELALADWQLGLLTGLAFGLLYTLLGFPIARLAERKSRPTIIAAAATTWSIFTILCGYAQNFFQLALMRVGVGIGEAGCTPPSHSLVMDYAEPTKRASALAFYGLGGPIGGLLGLGFGGIVADTLGWRSAFLIAGLPGLLLAVLIIATVPEPRSVPKRLGHPIKLPSVRDMRDLVRGKRSYWLLLAAMTFKVSISYGYGSFIASFYFRNHTEELAEAAETIASVTGLNLGPVGFMGLALGLLMGLGGAISTFIGGALADRFAPRDARNYLNIPAIAAMVAVPLFIGALFVSSFVMSLILAGLYVLFANCWYGPAYTAWFSLVPANMRATNSSISLFMSNLVGLGAAPLVVGIISDVLARSLGPSEGLRWALASLMFLGVLSAICFREAAKTFRTDVVEAEPST